ncbi:hypothetical protein BDK51DRAFT_14936, partial [Blyttiomyces helicus]
IITCPGQNQWGLTYDDGPTVNEAAPGTDDTAGLRSHLDSAGLKATFFIVGVNAVRNPTEIAASYGSGHHICAHTYTHHPLTSLTNEQIVAEFMYTESLIFQQIKKRPLYFRPPYGDIDNRVR